MTEKERLFADEYLIDLNGRRAYMSVYVNCKNERSADTLASRVLGKVDVQAYIQEKLAARSQRTEVTADMVINELRKIAFGDIRTVVAWGQPKVSKSLEWDEDLQDFRMMETETGGNVDLIGSADLTDDAAATITEVSEDPGEFGTKRKVKLADKTKALELLGRHLGIFAADNRQKKLFTVSDPNNPGSEGGDDAGLLRIEIVRPGEKPGLPVSPAKRVKPVGPGKK